MNKLKQLMANFRPSEKMPMLFIGHGNPMNAIEENPFVRKFREIGNQLPKPQAVLCVSAHWLTRGTQVTAMPKPRTIHDFYGFPQALYQQQYPAPGHPVLAEATREALAPTPVTPDHDWGFDHGTWAVLKHMFPAPDIPVIQLSIDISREPEYHFNLVKQLASLRDYGVLIIGSGNIVHNLRQVDFTNINKVDFGFDWALEARDLFNKHLLEGNFKPLLAYDKLGTAARQAVPTPDHYLPLLYALGLKETGESLSLFNDHLIAGSLSMTSVKIGGI